MAGPIVDLVLLRGLFADTTLRPGVVLAARVLDREGPRGTLLLGGVRVSAQLPPELAAGTAVRLRVTEAGPERIALQVVPPGSPDAAPPTVGLALPGGARLRVEPDPPEAQTVPREAERRSVALRFDSPALGLIDLLVDLAPDAASATVRVAPGAAAVARSAANDLRDGLAQATHRAASARVEERGVDVRA